MFGISNTKQQVIDLKDVVLHSTYKYQVEDTLQAEVSPFKIGENILFLVVIPVWGCNLGDILMIVGNGEILSIDSEFSYATPGNPKE